VPDIYAAVKDAEPLDEIVPFRFPANARRRYERLSRFPAGFLVLGDAVCSFNPIYGQGMSIAAIEADTLREHLRRGAAPRPRDFLGDIATKLDTPWEITTSGDLAFPEVEGRRTLKTRIGTAYLAKLHAAAVHDGTITTAFIRTAGLVDPPQALMKPAMMLKVLTGARRNGPGTARRLGDAAPVTA
jgi:hypothetical protein